MENIQSQNVKRRRRKRIESFFSRFVTDQFDPEHRVKDTLYFGEIIKKFIDDEYEIECEVKHYEWMPIDYNLTFDYFTKIAKHEGISKKIANEKIIDIEGTMESILKKNASDKEIDVLNSLII